jgi:hypothetical protein
VASSPGCQNHRLPPMAVSTTFPTVKKGVSPIPIIIARPTRSTRKAESIPVMGPCCRGGTIAKTREGPYWPAQEKNRRVGHWDGRRAQARYFGLGIKADQLAIWQRRPLVANASWRTFPDSAIKRSSYTKCDVSGFWDQQILLCKSGETWSELRRRPRAKRIRRDRLVIDQPGLKFFLLLTQLAATVESAQLVAKRPDGRTRARQSRASRVRQSIAQGPDWSDHETCARLLRLEQRAAVVSGPGTRVVLPGT